MTGRKSNRRESERVLAWRFFCEQKKEEISRGIRGLLKALAYFVLFASAAIILFWINWVILTSIAPLDCDMWAVTESSYSMCGFEQSLFSVLAIIIEIFVGAAILTWLHGNWNMAKYRAKEKLRGNGK